MRAPGRRALAALLALALGCAVRTAPADLGHASFVFETATFAFANETVWEYDLGTSRGAWRKREPRPDFALRCGTMVRAARQFWAHARFFPSAPVADASTYEAIVRAVLRSDPRHPSGKRLAIPGYPDLRSFSAAHEPLLKATMAGPWQSYVQRGNWRMIFPFTARHQRRLARRLLDSLARGWPPIVHVLRYPELTLNHLVLVYDAEETPAEIRFRAYDPNDAARPVLLTYDRAARMFTYAATPYFPGGPAKAYEVYYGLFY